VISHNHHAFIMLIGYFRSALLLVNYFSGTFTMSVLY